LKVEGLVEKPIALRFEEIQSLPRKIMVKDFPSRKAEEKPTRSSRGIDPIPSISSSRNAFKFMVVSNDFLSNSTRKDKRG
jgi:hypothetical protein